jgi:alkylated DNA repair protein (DNA oxidative demethylase)
MEPKQSKKSNKATHRVNETVPSNVPDACLINRYDPGARLTLHQDKNERDFDQPAVSVSLGLSAAFSFGGFNRADAAVRVKLRHGDVAVWGGPARLRYQGVLPLKEGHTLWWVAIAST